MHKLLRPCWRNLHFHRRNAANLRLAEQQQRWSSTQEMRTLEDVIADRRQQANRSIVVQVNSERSFSELFTYCQQFGEIEGCHHYKLSHDELHYILVEFQTESSAEAAMSSSCFNEDLSGVPIRSPFLWFRAGKKKGSPAKSASPKTSLSSLDGIHTIPNNELDDLLMASQDVEGQMQTLHRSTVLNDLGTRLRFLAARQVESTIAGMFPNANALPFGSSVNGFGRMGCDLDLILRFDKDSHLGCKSIDSRLVFHTKETLSNGRSQMQRQMECIGDLLHLFLPGVYHVRRILQARVPIIKFHHEHLDLEVDLSMSNLTGVYMSELLYMFGQIDDRVRPLTFCLRRWAQTCGLTNPSPGRWITNFSLTCLVIFYLQQLKEPILPPISLFVKSAKSNDLRVTEDGINCSFLRDVRNLPFKTENKSSLTELLLQFFEFYSQFDFNNRAISLNEARNIVKPDHSAMYIINPLEQHLNVSKNISLEECERFRIEVRNAAWILESDMERNTSNESREEPWGLLNLFRTPEKTIIRPNMFFKPRLVEVSELFDDSSADGEHRNLEFKNSTVKSQVRNARAQAKNDLKQLQAKLGGKTGGKAAR
ncbi:unnamed protein product [Hermetia illucens]|uniref:Poly(A) RNA polymerase, mitochondrial n=1 Tax=Hermetia illucens TaxID=343691 RepID=A0A7R8UVM0_HERIL|nr:poly(A) RNA polymerase, mitochondrial [Hermetia illucens]CAD7086738.1 unnamed protein product [Hermetia illucens]